MLLVCGNPTGAVWWGYIVQYGGDVTEQYNYDPLVYWDALPEYDNLLYERLMRDCVRKETM